MSCWCYRQNFCNTVLKKTGMMVIYQVVKIGPMHNRLHAMPECDRVVRTDMIAVWQAKLTFIPNY